MNCSNAKANMDLYNSREIFIMLNGIIIMGLNGSSKSTILYTRREGSSQTP
jgi:ABC-type proline/glycine betaine transport system ATPase subunit